MKLYLIHHADALSREQDPERRLSRQGCDECARLAARLTAAGAAPARILHSDKQWTRETAERIAAAMGLQGRTAQAAYPVSNVDPVAPFIREIEETGGDVMMAGHFGYLTRTASKLLCGDEDAGVVRFKPGNGAIFCLEKDGDGDWAVAWAWRQEHLAG
jgi:phosphohistidine phosphatase